MISTVEERDPASLAAMIKRDGPGMIAAFRAHGDEPVNFIVGKRAQGPVSRSDRGQ